MHRKGSWLMILAMVPAVASVCGCSHWRGNEAAGEPSAILTARELRITDHSGQVVATLSAGEIGPRLDLLDGQGVKRLAIGVDTRYGAAPGVPFVSLYGDNGLLGLGMNHEGLSIERWDTHHSVDIGTVLSSDAPYGESIGIKVANSELGSSVEMVLRKCRPAFIVKEGKRRVAVMGCVGDFTVASIIDGTEFTGPSSRLVLLGKDGQVLWEAP